MEWFWLLLPLAAASGWFSASMKKAGESGRPRIPPEFLLGLNMLLDQRHENAAEVFIKLFAVDADTVETHLVLGNLFRQKGEIEKALRIHKNIIARPNLDTQHRASALFEIGRDYFSAGLLDRAEKFYHRSLSEKDRQVSSEAYRQLLLLYEIEKEWEQAVRTVERLKKMSGEDYQSRTMHYHCEMAERALGQKDMQTTRQCLRKAQRLGRTSLRWVTLRGDMFFQCKDFSKALNCYVEAFKRYPEFSHYLVPKIEEARRKGSSEDDAHFLRKLDPKVVSGTYLVSYFRALLLSGKTFQAEQFFSDALAKERMPLALLRDFVHFKFHGNLLPEEYETFAKVLNCLDVLLSKSFAFECVHCGFLSHNLYWHCPSCMYWDTMSPCDTYEK